MKTEEIGEILNISTSAGAGQVSQLVEREVKVSVANVEQVIAGSFSLSDYEPAVCFEYEFESGISDKSLVIMKASDVSVLVGAVLQKDMPATFELDEVNGTAAAQIMGDFLNGSVVALSNFANINLSISELETFPVPNTEMLIKEYYNSDQPLCSVTLGITVNGLLDSEFVLILNETQADGLVGTFNVGLAASGNSMPEPAKADTSENSAAEEPAYEESGDSYDIRPVELQRYSDTYAENAEQTSNLNMLMNVPLQITVEIGRTKMQIKDILELTQGSIVELNKQAGSHVDVFVNGQPIASGEVVVVDDYYGVRISEIINTGEIMKIL